MDPTQAYQNRNDAFSEGTLSQAGAEYMSKVPTSFTPTSPLHQIMPSANGLGQSDASRRLIGGGLLATTNGMASDTYQVKRPFMSTTIGA